jgi:hypothetical protein
MPRRRKSDKKTVTAEMEDKKRPKGMKAMKPMPNDEHKLRRMKMPR